MSQTLRTARRAVVASAIALIGAACRDTAELRAPSIRGIRIEPTNFTLTTGSAMQLRAVVDADRGADTTVRWTSEPSATGSVSPTGLLTTCYPPGTVVVHATSVTDPTKSATLPVSVTVVAIGWASVTGVVRPGTLTSVPADSVTGDVDILASLSPGTVLACRGVERVDVRLKGPGIDTLLARFDFSPPFSDSRMLRAPLRTSSLPNGTYQTGGTVYVSGATGENIPLGRTITIRNP